MPPEKGSNFSLLLFSPSPDGSQNSYLGGQGGTTINLFTRPTGPDCLGEAELLPDSSPLSSTAGTADQDTGISPS